MDWMRYRLVYLLISLSVIGSGVFAIFRWGLPLGLDFKGGALIEYKIPDTSPEKVKESVEKAGVSVLSVQETSDQTFFIRSNELSGEKKEEVKKALEETTGKKVEELRYENVGPVVGSDLIRKTLYALGIAASLILIWIAFQFKSLKFGISGVVAMLHDSLVLLGLFAIFSHFFGPEIDFLFVTAALTILSFSVHDTIVVYDRIRETQKRQQGDLYTIANQAVTQTMVRSLNNSFTIIFMLVALILLGGSTIQWFAIALLVGTISGTYSSPFVAVPLLVTWDEFTRRIKR